MAETFSVSTSQPKQCIDITERVREIVRKSGVKSGLCQVMVLHATAAIAINENDDPNIGVDLLTALDRAIPDHAGWLHDRIDNNAQAHIKAWSRRTRSRITNTTGSTSAEATTAIQNLNSRGTRLRITMERGSRTVTGLRISSSTN